MGSPGCSPVRKRRTGRPPQEEKDRPVLVFINDFPVNKRIRRRNILRSDLSVNLIDRNLIYSYYIMITVLRGYKFRIYPTTEQEKILRQMVGCCRWMWNKLLEVNNDHYKATGQFIWYWWPHLKRLRTENPWLDVCYVQSYSEIAKHFESTLKKVGKGKKYPRFKKKHLGGSIPFGTVGRIIQNTITIPNLRVSGLKFQEGRTVKMIKHRSVRGKPKWMTVSLDVDQWFVSIICEIKSHRTHGDQKIGVDLGLIHLATYSDETQVDNPRWLRTSEKKLKKAQRRLNRKKKGSKNRNKQRIRVAKIHRKIRRQRDDFLHKTTARLIAKAETVCIEDLSTSGMLKNHCLAKSVADASMSRFRQFLTYKAWEAGVKLVVVSRWYPSSKRCSKCGWIKKDLTLKDRVWTCDACGAEHDRDFNAATNILNEGLQQSTVGTTGTHACGPASAGDLVPTKSRQVGLKQEKELAVTTAKTPSAEVN
jgi:putative transposase